MMQISKIKEKQDKIIPIVILFVSSLIVITIVSKSSPLYYLNDWVDLNAFLTMGKAWNHGMIPYRDLFEQKGPILYAIFAIASKISSSYFGVFILETISLTISSILLFRIAKLFFNNNKSMVFVFISYIILCVTPYFKWGGSAEEFGWVSILYSIYLIFLLQKNDFEISRVHYFFSGVMLAYLFWIKYTMIGSWIGFFVSLAICLLIKKKYKDLLMTIFISLFGFLSVTAPILIYFYVNNAIDNLFFAYFYSNIKLYPNNLELGLMSKLLNAMVIYVKHMFMNPYLFVLLIVGFMGLILSDKIIKNNYTLFMYSSAYFLLIITVLFGGKDWNYYYLIIFPFAVISILLFLEWFGDINVMQLSFTFILCMFTVAGTNQTIQQSKLFPKNASLSTEGSDYEPAQIQFAKIMNKEKNPTLLNYGTLDVGLYHSANVLPQNYYFMRQNISDDLLPELMEEQNEIVDNKKVDFIVTANRRELGDKDIPDNIKKNYKLVGEHSQDFEGDRTYRLYKKK